MDLGNDNEGDSAEAMTSTLKGMLKINGNGTDGLDTPEKDGATPRDGDKEQETQKQDSVDEEASVPPDQSVQRIYLDKALDGECIPIHGEEVYIVTSPNSDIESKTSGSNQVRIRPITKFEWEHKYYTGTLVCVTNNYTAYAIKSRSYAVRVISRKNSSDRLLLRGFTAPVCDVAFAHATSSLISAVDEDGNFIIWQLSQAADNTVSTKKLHVEATPDLSATTYHRLVWLTYMHCDIDGNNVEDLIQIDEEAEPDPTNHKKLLAVTHGSLAEVWDINAAFDVADGEDGATSKDRLEHTFMTIKEHEDVISDCELSPEGSVLAVASHDGYVKFWQISIENTEEPTCLHRWKPHGDRPVSLVTFCDDRKQPQLVLYWRFMLTGCNQNSELKIWCTVSWSCLQTLSFEPSPGVSQMPALKCALHAASDYLVVSDINRKVLYVLHCLTDLDKGRAFMSSISQYLLTTPLLSFAIIDARQCKFKMSVNMEEEGEAGDELEDVIPDDYKEAENTEGAAALNDIGQRTRGVLIKLVSIQTKSLESLDIRFIPKPNVDDSSLSLSTYNTLSDELNVVSVEESLSIISPSLENGHSQELEDAQQEEEEGDTSNNKTAVTAREGDQSTILAGDDEDLDLIHSSQKELNSQDNDEGSGETGPKEPTPRTSIMDLVGDVTEDTPMAHSSPSGPRHYSLTDDHPNRGQGEGEDSSPEKLDSHPVLLTPDAFTSSLRKPEGAVSAESSFTHVTPFSVDHPSLFASERDKSMQESALTKSPILPSSPPGFPETSAARSISPLIPVTSSVQSSLELGGVTSYHSLLHSLPQNEPGPFGDVQPTGYMTKDKSPDLISSASTLESVGASSEARVLIGGPMSGAVGGGGDTLFLAGQPPSVVPPDEAGDSDSQASIGSKRSDHLPAMSSAPWPKAPDVTMSRPVPRKVTPTSSREDFLRTSERTQQHQTSRPDSVLHADVMADDQNKLSISANMADVLAAVIAIQKRQEEIIKMQQQEKSKTYAKVNQVLKNVDTVLKKFEQQQGEKLDQALRAMSDTQRKFQADSKSYNATSTELASGKMERVIRQEVKSTVLPGLSRCLDPLKDQLHNTLAQKLTATDAVLKESVGKLVRSKDLLETIGASAGRAIQPQVHNSFKDTFMTIVVPAMEKSCNTMFQQLSSVFQRGLDDVVSKLEKQFQSRVKVEMERLQSAQKQAKEATEELRDVAAHAHAKIASAAQNEVQKIVATEMKTAQDSTMKEVTKLLQRQQEAALKEHKVAMTECIRNALAELPTHHGHSRTKLPGDKSSHPGTPARSAGPLRPTFEQQQQTILSLLHQGNLNAAFQRALTASDLALVMYVCEMVDPAVVFGSTPCPLNQPILLSLIQQLSCDLGRNTVTKLKYLQEAVMNLDRNHSVTQEHMHTVLDSLVKNLNTHVATLSAAPVDSANTPVIKQMRMLAMAAQSLIQ